MDFSIDHCRTPDFAELLSELDHEFVFAKGRRESLAKRFPGSLTLENVFVARTASTWAAAVTVRPFDWITGSHLWRGAMVGLVYTRPAFRGHGAASAVLRYIEARLRSSRSDFAVLWTGIPDYYSRLGWNSQDCGMLGACLGDPQAPTTSLKAQPLTGTALAQVEGLRAGLPRRVARTTRDYSAVPLPADRTAILISGHPPATGGYALFGERGSTRYVYELVGQAADLESLWSRIRAGTEHVLVNDQLDSPTFRWLSDNGAVTWMPQHLAMWLSLAQQLHSGVPVDWHIPFFDRL